MLNHLWNSLDARGRVFLAGLTVLAGLFLWTLFLVLVTMPEAPGPLVDRYLRGELGELRDEALLIVLDRHGSLDTNLVGPAGPPACRPHGGVVPPDLVCEIRFPVGSKGELLVPVLVLLEGRPDLLGRVRYEITGRRLMRWGVAVVLDGPG